MSDLDPEVVAAIQAISSADDFNNADAAVKEALQTWEFDTDDSAEVAAVLAEPTNDQQTA
jgi:hypothetical protein